MIVLNNEVKLEPLNEKMSRKILNHSPELMVVEVHFLAGGVGEPHDHSDHEQISYVVKGRFELILGEEKHIVGKGDTFYAGKQVRHGVRALEDSVLLDVFAPRRDDFLQQMN